MGPLYGGQKNPRVAGDETSQQVDLCLDVPSPRKEVWDIDMTYRARTYARAYLARVRPELEVVVHYTLLSFAR